MIIVTGATGQLGRAIVKGLLRRVPATQVGASCRDPEKAAALAALGVRVRKGDFDDEATLTHAFEGATQVLLVSSNARAYGGDAVAQHRTAIAAARKAGARRLLYTSHMAASAASQFSPMLDHAATEAFDSAPLSSRPTCQFAPSVGCASPGGALGHRPGGTHTEPGVPASAKATSSRQAAKTSEPRQKLQSVSPAQVR